MGDELPGLQGEFKIPGCPLSPAPDSLHPGRLVEGLLNLYQPEIHKIAGHAPLEAAAAQLPEF